MLSGCELDSADLVGLRLSSDLGGPANTVILQDRSLPCHKLSLQAFLRVFKVALGSASLVPEILSLPKTCNEKSPICSANQTLEPNQKLETGS